MSTVPACCISIILKFCLMPFRNYSFTLKGGVWLFIAMQNYRYLLYHCGVFQMQNGYGIGLGRSGTWIPTWNHWATTSHVTSQSYILTLLATTTWLQLKTGTPWPGVICGFSHCIVEFTICCKTCCLLQKWCGIARSHYNDVLIQGLSGFLLILPSSHCQFTFLIITTLMAWSVWMILIWTNILCHCGKLQTPSKIR